MEDPRRRNKLALFISSIGPGLFLIGYNIGTGSITTMAKAGAKYGMTLFWALLLSCIFTYILMVAYGQVTLVTGRTALFNIKSQWKYGKILAIYIMIALILGELLALMGVLDPRRPTVLGDIDIELGTYHAVHWTPRAGWHRHKRIGDLRG